MSKENAKRKITTKMLVTSAVAIALAMVTSNIKLIDMPMGGSVTLCSMLFVCMIGYFYGPYVGFVASVAYGILQFIFGGYMLNIPQVLVDYLFSFGILGVSGFFKNRKYGLMTGYLAGVLGRYFFAFLSGMIFFGEYAADYNMTAPVYSLLYNGAYLGLEALITVIIIVIPPVAKGIDYVKRMVTE